MVKGPLGALIVAFASLLTAAAATASTPGLTTAVYLNGEPDTSLALDRVAAAGATAVRVNMWWSLVAGNTPPADPTNPSDPSYDWSQYDPVISAAAARGFQVYITIVGAPAWAQTPPVAPLFGNSRLPDATAFGQFAQAAATRYGGSVGGLPRVTYWEAWNEPNISLYLIPQLDAGQPLGAERYRDMLNAFAAAVHGVHADNVVIAGGLAPFLDNSPDIVAQNPDWGPLAFMRAVLCLSPANTPTCSNPVHFDDWAMHPYVSGGPDHHASLPNDVSIADLPKVQAMLLAAGIDGHIVSSAPPGLWVTEFSWDSNPPDPLGVPEPLLSRWVSLGLYRMWQSGVSLVTWLSLNDNPPGGLYQSGLYYNAGDFAADTPKPFLQAYRFPVVAFRRRQVVSVWGRTPAGQPGDVVVEQQRGDGTWATLGTLTTTSTGIFQSAFTSARGGDVRARVIGTGETSLGYSLANVPDQSFTPFGGLPLEPPATVHRPSVPHTTLQTTRNRVAVQTHLP